MALDDRLESELDSHKQRPMNEPRTSAEQRLERALLRLNALVNWERRDKDARMRRGLEPIQDILRRLGHPEREWRAVHVAGTKGKGTTSSLVASALARSGVHVGLYTSPHVSRIHERIRIDGRDVDDGAFACALESSLAAREEAIAQRERLSATIGIASDVCEQTHEARAPDSDGSSADGAEATWFDLMTAAAFLVFAEARVEWAVVECGLGGRLDSTNAVDGEVCVITNIDLEHTAVLGSTRAEIAREKAGIVKSGSTVVTGVAIDDEAGRVIQSMADRAGSTVLRPQGLASTMLGRDVDLARLVLDELGRRGAKMRAGKPFSRAMLDERAIEAARLPARSEKLWADGTRVVLDGAHVASSVKMVLDELARDPELGRRPTAVLALGRDKDVCAILKTLVGRVDRLVCTTAATGPLMSAENLANEAARAGIEAETAPDPSRAFARALDLAQPEGWVLVIGSFYLAGALRSHLHTEPPSPREHRDAHDRL
jgi:dihydrofolate synthase / folylpolyglutamate synthase